MGLLEQGKRNSITAFLISAAPVMLDLDTNHIDRSHFFHAPFFLHRLILRPLFCLLISMWKLQAAASGWSTNRSTDGRPSGSRVETNIERQFYEAEKEKIGSVKNDLM